MAERTLAQVATAARPSMVAGTEEEAFVEFIDARGPFKVETIYFQQDAANDFAANDTHNSRLAHPLFAIINAVTDIAQNQNASRISVDLTSDESNANFKQLTIRDCEGVNGLGILIQVFGF